jgi:ribosomal protein S18 acetylase RimI-like enzyme
MPLQDLRVRAADPRTERDRILPVLRRNLSAAGAVERFNWLYLENPHGLARLWVAETAHGEIVGTSAAHPKRAWIDGDLHDVLDLSDFALDPRYRSAGPGLRLLRATLAGIADDDVALSYDHPSPAMLALHLRLGGRDVSARRRWTRLLEVSGDLGKRFGAAARTVGRLGDLALRGRDALARRSTRAVTPLHGPCGEEFDRLDRETRTRTRFRVQRSAAALRWRFQRYPIARHEVLCARDGGHLCGYVVFRPRADRVLAIVDLLTNDDDRWTAPLIDAVVQLGHQRRQRAVWVTVLRDSPIEAHLARNHFTPRAEEPGLVITASKLAGLAAELRRPQQWWMLEGDEDV